MPAFAACSGDGDVELLDECGERLVGQLLLRVRGVARLRGAEAVALDRHGEDDGGAALVLHRALVGVVDLDRVVAAAVQAIELLVGVVLDQLEQLGILAEEVLAQVGAVLGLVGLEVAVDALFHAAEQQAGVVAREELVPVRAPDDLDDVPTGAEEDAFELVDDALVAAHRAVQPLQVAVDDEDRGCRASRARRARWRRGCRPRRSRRRRGRPRPCAASA